VTGPYLFRYSAPLASLRLSYCTVVKDLVDYRVVCSDALVLLEECSFLRVIRARAYDRFALTDVGRAETEKSVWDWDGLGRVPAFPRSRAPYVLTESRTTSTDGISERRDTFFLTGGGPRGTARAPKIRRSRRRATTRDARTKLDGLAQFRV